MVPYELFNNYEDELKPGPAICKGTSLNKSNHEKQGQHYLHQLSKKTVKHYLEEYIIILKQTDAMRKNKAFKNITDNYNKDKV